MDDSERIYTRGPAAPVSSRVAGTAGRHVEFTWIRSCRMGRASNASDYLVRALIRCEPRLGRLPVGGGSQALGHQQECREDQGVHNRDRDHANGKTAVMVIKVRP